VGFEPTRPERATGSPSPSLVLYLPRFQSRTKSSGKRERRIENGENSKKRILKEFEDFLRVDRQLAEETVERHMLEIRKLFKNSKFDPLNPKRSDIIEYLKRFVERSSYTYANILKALRVFYKDFLQKGEVIEGFKFPERPISAKIIPSKEDLQKFYRFLDEPLAKAIFLIFATTGLRRKEVFSLRIGDIDFKRKMIVPEGGSRTKRAWVTFYNEEAEKILREYLGSFENKDREEKLFPASEKYFRRRYKEFERLTGIRITPQVLREWFACEMGRLGVPDRYVDAFCGRVPRSVLARHYTDFSPEKLMEIYEKADLKVLG